MLYNKTISRSYIFSQKELCEKLGVMGEIQDIGLWEGLSPNKESKGVSTDKIEWEIVTHENQEEEKVAKK